MRVFFSYFFSFFPMVFKPLYGNYTMYGTLCQYNIMHAFAYSWICVLTMPNSTRFYNILNVVIQKWPSDYPVVLQYKKAIRTKGVTIRETGVGEMLTPVFLSFTATLFHLRGLEILLLFFCIRFQFSPSQKQ